MLMSTPQHVFTGHILDVAPQMKIASFQTNETNAVLNLVLNCMEWCDLGRTFEHRRAGYLLSRVATLYEEQFPVKPEDRWGKRMQKCHHLHCVTNIEVQMHYKAGSFRHIICSFTQSYQLQICFREVHKNTREIYCHHNHRCALHRICSKVKFVAVSAAILS